MLLNSLCLFMKWLLLLKHIWFLCCQCLHLLVFFDSTALPIVFINLLIFAILFEEWKYSPKVLTLMVKTFLAYWLRCRRRAGRLQHTHTVPAMVSSCWHSGPFLCQSKLITYTQWSGYQQMLYITSSVTITII